MIDHTPLGRQPVRPVCPAIEQVDCPIAPCTRGFRQLATHRLHAILERHRAWLAQLRSERGIWPPPDCARLYLEAVITEAEAALADRARDEGSRPTDPQAPFANPGDRACLVAARQIFGQNGAVLTRSAPTATGSRRRGVAPRGERS